MHLAMWLLIISLLSAASTRAENSLDTWKNLKIYLWADIKFY